MAATCSSVTGVVLQPAGEGEEKAVAGNSSSREASRMTVHLVALPTPVQRGATQAQRGAT
eukprot:361616-Chlamydomonas_euryale.AAC.16